MKMLSRSKLLFSNDSNTRLIRLSASRPRSFVALGTWCSKFTAPLILHGFMLKLLGEPKTKSNDKIYVGVLFAVFTLLLGLYLYFISRNNYQEREDFKKLQALLEKSDIVKLIQAALEANLTLSQSEILQPEIILSDRDRADAEWMLHCIKTWARSNNELAEILPVLFTAVTGQVIPQPFQDAMGRLMFEAGISPLKQIEAKLDSYNIPRTFGKGGFYLLGTHVHSENVNLKQLFDLVRAGDLISLELFLLHDVEHYKAILTELCENPDPVAYAAFKKVFLEGVQKALMHDGVQTTFKLGLGAFGWQCAYRIFLGNTQYSSSFFVWNWQKPLLWFSTGVGASTALSSGILMSQLWLSHQHQGINSARFKTLLLQLMFSVTVADSLWQPCADLGILYVAIWKTIQPEIACYIVEPIVFFMIYLSLSFFFKEIHNWTNLVHEENSGQRKFVCTNEFVGILASTYWSFKVIFGLISSQTNLAEFNAKNIFIDCLLAGVCSAFLPMLLITGQNFRKIQILSDSIEKNVTLPLRDNRNENPASLDELEQPLLVSSQNTHPAIQANVRIHDNYLTTFCLKPLAQISKVYDKVVENAASFFP